MEWLKAMQLSFAVHVLMVLGIVGISSFMVTGTNPIVIDFLIQDSGDSGTETVQEKALLPKPTPQTKAKNPEARRQPDVGRENSMSQATIVSKSESEFQAPVPVAAPPKENTFFAGRPPEKPATDTGEKRRPATAESGESAVAGPEGIRKKYLNENFAYIRDTVLKNLSYPLIARKMGWTGKVMLSFFISHDGSVKGIKVTQSSGIDVLDKNAIEAVKKAAPFPRPPAEAEVVIPIMYRLN